MTSTEAPAAATSYTPFVTDLMRLARAPFAPTAVFEEQREQPSFWMPWLAVSVLIAAGTWLTLPFQSRAMSLTAAAAGQPAPPEWVLLIGVAAVPVVMLVMLLIGAAILYFASLGVGGELGFKEAMTVTVFGTAVAVFQTFAGVAQLHLRGIESVQTAADVQPSFGLDLLLPADVQLGRFLQGVASSLGPFEVWAFALSAIGLMVLGRMSKGKAWTAATIALLFGVLVRGAFSLLRPA
jgi:hypothetical protein